MRDAAFVASIDSVVDIDGLIAWLTAKGFNRASTVIEQGDFAVRGGIIDIFPPGDALPVRLDFFGDVLEGARRFDPDTQRTVETITRVELAPASEVVLDPASIQRFRTRYRETFGAARLDDPLYAAVSEGRKYQGMEHWVALFHEADGDDVRLPPRRAGHTGRTARRCPRRPLGHGARTPCRARGQGRHR